MNSIFPVITKCKTTNESNDIEYLRSVVAEQLQNMILNEENQLDAVVDPDAEE